MEDYNLENYSSEEEMLADLNTNSLEENLSQPTINMIHGSINDYLKNLKQRVGLDGLENNAINSK